MANPKRKTSKTRRDKRRTHYKATEPTLGICPTTKTPHLYHRAYLVDNDLYYRGQLLVEGFKKAGKNA
ncbi:MAG: 50S ribosomal protein L32 [Microscillaceae bacterium]|nr:50S ribosomal protein L32 [Microscillaceae bacterium]MDW8461297.1 50S ribosomal protein L32 [Cytophagales bacterium]